MARFSDFKAQNAKEPTIAGSTSDEVRPFLNDKEADNKADSCPLCGGAGPLRQSHVISKFAFDWLKETSATGFLRYGPQPNLRAQDGFKEELLCDSCEQLISSWETPTAQQLFKPYHADSSVVVTYGPWLARSGASLAWRVLFVLKERGLANLSTSQQTLANLALESWRRFIVGERANPGSFELHLLPVDFLESATGDEVPPNINRYLGRAIEMDAVAKKGSAFVYVKMARLVFIGVIEQPVNRQWHGSRLGITKGVVQPSSYKVPPAFMDYVFSRAARMGEIMQSLSPRQKARINETMKKSIDRATQSETFQAMTHDFAMFGDDAFAQDETCEFPSSEATSKKD